MDPLVITLVVIYLLGMHAIAWWASRRIKTNEDFMVAGRRLGPWMLAGSLAATEVGGGSSLGVAEKAYGEWGFSACWYVLAMACTFALLGFIAPALRATMVKTVPEFFRARYGPKNGIYTTVILILPMIGLTAIQLMASATIMTVMTGLSYSVSAVIVTVLVTEYSVLGGLWSVTLTDAVQWVLIVFGCAMIIPFGLETAGGWEQVMAVVPAEKMHPVDGIGWKTIIGLVVMYFTSFAVGQEAVQRFYAARDAKAARTGSFIAAIFYVFFACIPAFIGILAFAMVQNGTLDASLIEANGTRYVLPTMAAQVLPPVMVALLFAALISATMSSADSDLLAAGSLFANDLYRAHLKPDATDAQVLKVTRITMVVVGVLSLGVALLDIQDLIGVLMFSFSLRAGGAFIPYVIGHYWKKASAIASASAITTGSATVILARLDIIPAWGFDPTIVGVLVSAITFVVCTKYFPAQNPQSSPIQVFPSN